VDEAGDPGAAGVRVRARLERIPLPALGAAGGVLLALGLPPFAFPPLAAAGVLAFVLVLDRASTLRSGALAGGAFGGAASLVALHWIPAAAEPWMGLAGGLAAGLSTWMLHACIGGVVVAASARLRDTLPLAVRAAAAWGVLEWLPGAIPIIGMPWFGIAATLTGWPALLPLAAVAGSAGVGVLLAAVLGGGVRFRREPRTAVAVGVLALVVGGGAVVLPATPAPDRDTGPVAGPGAGSGTGPTLDVPDPAARMVALEWVRPRDEVADPERLRARVEAMIAVGLPSDTPDAPSRAVLWPEAPLPGVVGEGDPGAAPAGEDLLTRYMRRVQASGASGDDPAGALTGVQARVGGRAYNTLVRTGAEGEAPEGVHRKRHLVPGVERTVLTGAGLERRGLAPGAGALPFTWGGGRVGGLICFEILHAPEAARLRRRGAIVLVQATNDTMLQPGGRFPVVADAARRQHEAMLRLRAAEFRMPAIRAAHGGRAQASGPDGRSLEPVSVVVLGPPGEPLGRWLDFELPAAGPTPPSAWVGPPMGPLALAVFLLPLVALWRREQVLGAGPRGPR
jgi:apolipoprotein N-acyltransferase